MGLPSKEVRDVFDAANDTWILTSHAKARKAGRGVSMDSLDMVLNYGVIRPATGSVLYRIEESSVRDAGLDNIDLRPLLGVGCIVDSCNRIVTVLRGSFKHDTHRKTRSCGRREKKILGRY